MGLFVKTIKIKIATETQMNMFGKFKINQFDVWTKRVEVLSCSFKVEVKV